jgi:peroxiredoxin
MNAYFDTSLNSSPDLIALRDKMSMLEKVAVNEKFTNISLPDTSGNLISISDYEGSCILLDFWASWCGPCIGEFPALKNTYQKYKDKGFTIIGISFDQDLDHWKNSILNEQLAWVHMSAPEAWASDVGKRYVIGGIPANVLIAPDGTIVGRNLQSLELNQKLSEIFGF